MTYNLRGPYDSGERAWEVRCPALADLLLASAPSILGTQEGLRGPLEDLARLLADYDWVGAEREPGGEHCAIFFRRETFDLLSTGTFWLSELPDTPASRSWKSACTRICTWAELRHRDDGGVHRVFNCHLDHVSAEARIRGIELVLARASGPLPAIPTVIMGDFNEDEREPVGLALSAALCDTFRSVRPHESDVATYTDFEPERRSGPKIDGIYCTHHYRVVDAKIVRETIAGRQPSDHFPVVADLAL
jgi:endonuclease/exonuclease/phosphatase family metal-dependent hydrolase